MKDEEGALEDFGSAIKLSPHSAHMYFNRANLFASLQQLDKANQDYSKGKSIIKFILSENETMLKVMPTFLFNAAISTSQGRNRLILVMYFPLDGSVASVWSHTVCYILLASIFYIMCHSLCMKQSYHILKLNKS